MSGKWNRIVFTICVGPDLTRGTSIVSCDSFGKSTSSISNHAALFRRLEPMIRAQQGKADVESGVIRMGKDMSLSAPRLLISVRENRTVETSLVRRLDVLYCC